MKALLKPEQIGLNYILKVMQNNLQLAINSQQSGLISKHAKKAKELGLGLNAGHDLDLTNLKFLKENIPWLDEVSIGHALFVMPFTWALKMQFNCIKDN